MVRCVLALRTQYKLLQLQPFCYHQLRQRVLDIVAPAQTYSAALALGLASPQSTDPQFLNHVELSQLQNCKFHERNKNSLKIQDSMSPQKMINPIIMGPNETDLEEFRDK